MRKLLLALLFIPSIAHAAPTYVLCVKGDKITAKPVCSRGEVRLSVSGLSIQAQGAQGFQGPQGPQGVPGANGINGQQGPQGLPGKFDVSTCSKRESTASGAGNVSTSASCLVSEFAMSSGCFINSGSAIITSQRLINGTGSLIGDQAYNIIRCNAWDPFDTGLQYTIVAQAFCCRGL